MDLLPSIRDQLPCETYSAVFREHALRYLESQAAGLDASAQAFQRLLQEHDALLRGLIDQTTALADRLCLQSLDLVPCHGDFHSGNFLIEADGTLHPVDWDTLSLAPREKDLMFVGAGIGGMAVNGDALRYFRLERVVQDLVAYAEQLLGTPEGGEDRPVMLRQFARQFEPGGVIDVALR